MPSGYMPFDALVRTSLRGDRGRYGDPRFRLGHDVPRRGDGAEGVRAQGASRRRAPSTRAAQRDLRRRRFAPLRAVRRGPRAREAVRGAGRAARRRHRRRGQRVLRASGRQRAGPRASGEDERLFRRGRRGRVDDHPAAREELDPHVRSHLRPQGQGGRARRPHGARAVEEPDPGELPQHGLLRARRLRRQRRDRAATSTRTSPRSRFPRRRCWPG